jgi:tRNA threonylcarbamoyladenosine biosynthesis protein TsaE
VSGSDARRAGSVEATERLGAALAPALRAGDVVVLSGDLGAGKTRFVAGIARALCPGARVRSPSFTLVNEYAGAPPLFHLDLYRLGTGEVDGLGLEEYSALGPLVVEWGERLPAAWRGDALHVAFTGSGEAPRTLAAGAAAGRGLELLAAWRAIPQTETT